MAATPTSSNKHILDRTQPTSTLRVKFAATVVVARRRLKPAGPDVLKLSELVNSDNTEKFVVACNKDAVKSKMPEVNRDFQINRWDDLKEDVFIKAF